MNRIIELGLHPVALAGSLLLFLALGGGPLAVLVTFFVLQGALLVLQRLVPERPDWRMGIGESLLLVATAAIFTVAIGVIATLQDEGWALLGLAAPAGRIAGWPIAAQVIALFFGADLIYYWIHRAIHRWPWLWRVSGHGVHHAFHRLHAAHAGVTHPFELVLLALPMSLLAMLTGPVPEAVIVATLLLLSNVMLAHCNLRMATPLLKWVLTTSEQHRRHHSSVFEESNSNYACNAILWDRLFGTYGGGTSAQTGIGPRQPGVVELLRMPFREPDDAETVSSRRRG